MFPVRFKGTKNMCLSKNKGYKLLKVSLTKGTVYSANYKLCATNYKVNGAAHDGRSLRATAPLLIPSH